MPRLTATPKFGGAEVWRLTGRNPDGTTFIRDDVYGSEGEARGAARRLRNHRLLALCTWKAVRYDAPAADAADA